MKATLTDRPQKFWPHHRRERSGFYSEYVVLAVDPTDEDSDKRLPAHPIVTLRTYWPGETNVYACLWVNGPSQHHSGSGVAGGGGYCKQSAAADEAIRAAGIDLDQSIHGAGTRAIEDAVMAIAREVRPEGWALVMHVAHP